ncbi:MAG: hypothetical protein ACPHER_06765 [Nevskiales bacterium]
MQEFPPKTAKPAPGLKAISRRLIRIASLSLLTALTNACDQATIDKETQPPSGQLTATSVQKIKVLHIAVGDCSTVLRQNLAEHGFNIHRSGAASASLHLSLSNQRPLREHLPLIHTLGWQAHYRADITGAQSRKIFTVLGQEGSLSKQELCDDIGDEIAQKLREQLNPE